MAEKQFWDWIWDLFMKPSISHVVIVDFPLVLIFIGCLLLLRRGNLGVYLMLVGNLITIVISLTYFWLYFRMGTSSMSGIDFPKWCFVLSLSGIGASFLFGIGFLLMAFRTRQTA
jgi:hypothetical protein